MGIEKGRCRQIVTNNRLESNVQAERVAVFLTGRVTGRYTGSQTQ